MLGWCAGAACVVGLELCWDGVLGELWKLALWPGNCATWWRVLGEAYLGACSPGCSALWPPYPPPLLLRLLLRCCLWPRPHG